MTFFSVQKRRWWANNVDISHFHLSFDAYKCRRFWNTTTKTYVKCNKSVVKEDFIIKRTKVAKILNKYVLIICVKLSRIKKKIYMLFQKMKKNWEIQILTLKSYLCVLKRVQNQQPLKIATNLLLLLLLLWSVFFFFVFSLFLAGIIIVIYRRQYNYVFECSIKCRYQSNSVLSSYLDRQVVAKCLYKFLERVKRTSA